MEEKPINRLFCHDYFPFISHCNQERTGSCKSRIRSSPLLTAYFTRTKFICADCTLYNSSLSSPCQPVYQSLDPSIISSRSTLVPHSITAFQLSCSPRLAQISLAATNRKKCCNEGICIQRHEGLFL